MTQDNVYIKIPAIYKKIRAAEKAQKTLYIQASSGYGKTSAVLNYYRKNKILMLSGAKGFLEEMPEPSSIAESIVFIDDVSMIRDEQSKKYVERLAQDRSRHLILAGRGNIPSWLKTSYIKNPFQTAGVKDLRFGPEETKAMLKSRGIEASRELVRTLTEDSLGNGLSLLFHIYRYETMVPGQTYGPRVHHEARHDYFRYFEETSFSGWDAGVQEMLLALADYPVFDIAMAQAISEDNNAARYIEELQETGSSIFLRRDGSMELHFVLRDFLLWRRSIIWSDEQIRRNHDLAGQYYEKKGEFKNALEQYSLSGNTKRMQGILIENAKKQVGTANLYELRKYYFQLPEEEILDNPVIMSGLSILYSLLMQSEKSEYWYGRLKEYEQHCKPGSIQRKTAKERLLYLDIGLPHRGIVNMKDVLTRAARMYLDKEILLPEWSLTSNLPSIMNGGKDFSAWSKIDKQLALVLGKPLEMVLGKFGIGLVNTSLGESGFEKGNADRQELLKYLNTGYMQASTGGSVEVSFAAAGVLAKMHMQQGQPNAALKLMDAVEKRAVEEKADWIMPNLEAFKTWIALECGRTELAERWMNGAPDENTDFNVLSRYQYMIKFRAYILFGKYEEAWSLSERMEYYCSEHHRFYVQTENLLLRAILHYRRGSSLWESALMTALKRCEKYHFVWIAAREGAALMPLLQKCRDNPFFKSSFGREILEKTNQMACIYPTYLAERKIIIEPLTETEEKILRMHCMGLSTSEILGRLFIQESTLKFHNSNIFRKLEVKNRQEAVRIARECGLIQLGDFDEKDH